MEPTSIVIVVVVGVPLLAGMAYFVRDLAREQLRGRRRRSYKSQSLTDRALNTADHETWTTGDVPGEGKPELDAISSRILPVAQLVTVFVLVIAVLAWNNVLANRIESQERQLAELQAQVHALAFAPSASVPQVLPDPAAAGNAPVGLVATGTPIQQVCANLIGRVADAYEKAENSKNGQSLEQLIKRLGCDKQLATPP